MFSALLIKVTLRYDNSAASLKVMGHVIGTGLELVGMASSVEQNERLASAVRRTVELAKTQEITPRESQHVRAMELFSRG